MSSYPDIMVLSKHIPGKRVKLIDTVLDQVPSNGPHEDEEKGRTDERVELGWVEVEVRTSFLWEEETIK